MAITFMVPLLQPHVNALLINGGVKTLLLPLLMSARCDFSPIWGFGGFRLVIIGHPLGLHSGVVAWSDWMSWGFRPLATDHPHGRF